MLISLILNQLIAYLCKVKIAKEFINSWYSVAFHCCLFIHGIMFCK